ncbi:hypothetical protein [Halomontanus rarus]|uniref:hypothetical protein n=1 Tax=Halomontanus rarus TaxID=3034020 RepID=UPI00293BAC70|nr:hypothetical protein [Halovivax sp. KZCA124]
MTASRWSTDGERDTTPTTDYALQKVTNLEIHADIDDTALIINEAYEDDLGNVLADIAERSDSVWAIQDGDQTAVEWCQLGRRTIR